MSFLYPLFLIGALAVSIPLLLHFQRRDVAPEVPFSAVRLLQSSPIDRSHRRRLRDLILLAARIAALLLLAAAFARPYLLGAAAASEGVRIVAIDRSFSMGGPGTFPRALDLARRAIDETGLGDRVVLLAFDDRADVMADGSGAGDARAALAGMKPGYGATRFAAVLARAAELADGGPGRIILITDLQRTGWGVGDPAALPSNLRLDIRDAGAPPPNLSVAGVRVERDRLIATVRNMGLQAAAGELRVERDGRVVMTAAWKGEAAASVDVAIAYRSPSDGSIAVSVEDPGGLPADNTRFVMLGRAPAAQVLIVASGQGNSGFYLSRALDASADAGEATATTDAQVHSGAAVSALTPEELAGHAAIVLLSTDGLDRRAREGIGGFVKRGGGILVGAGQDVDPEVLASVFGWPSLTAEGREPGAMTLSPNDLRHPIFRAFGPLTANLGQVRFDRAWRMRPDGWEVAAMFTDGSPALLERREGSGRVVLFASDFDRRWNDFPLHPSFVPFVAEAVRYVSQERDRGREYTVSHAPPGAEARPGIFRAQGDGRFVAVNADARESATAVMTPVEFDSAVARVAGVNRTPADGRAQQTEALQGFWQYGLLLMLATLVAESFIGRA